MKTVHCDRCQRSIDIALIESPARDGDGVEQYFDCPHCQARYWVIHITALGVKLRGELRQLRQINHRHPTQRTESALEETYRRYLAQLRDLTKPRPPAAP